MTVAATDAGAEAGPPQRIARLAGALYTLNIATIWLAIFLAQGIVVAGDPAATIARLAAHAGRLQLAISAELVSTACSIGVAALLYELFRSVDAAASLAAAFFRLAACAAAMTGYLLQAAPLRLAAGGPAGLALALALQRLRAPATDMVVVYFGVHFVLLGWLIWRSRRLPLWMGGLAAAAGLGALGFLVPGIGHPAWLVAPGALVELSLAGWLLVRGVEPLRG